MVHDGMKTVANRLKNRYCHHSINYWLSMSKAGYCRECDMTISNQNSKYYITVLLIFVLAIGMLSVFCLPAAADEPQALEQASNDPTASLLSISLANLYSGDYHNLDDESGNSVQLRLGVPFKTGNLKHIARATLPIITDSPTGETGLGDAILFDLMTFDASWGRWGAGLVALLPTASDEKLGSEKFGAGPAMGFIARRPGFLWGIFNQNVFSFAGESDREDVQISILQPIANISLPNKWSFGLSEMNITYDWEKSAWTSLPLGIKINKLVKFSGSPVTFSAGAEYNFQDDYPAPEWTVNCTMKFLFPI